MIKTVFYNHIIEANKKKRYIGFINTRYYCAIAKKLNGGI